MSDAAPSLLRDIVYRAAQRWKAGRCWYSDAFASAVMGLGLSGLMALLHPYFDPAYGLLVQIAALALLIGVGISIYFAIATAAGSLKPRTLLKELIGR